LGLVNCINIWNSLSTVKLLDRGNVKEEINIVDFLSSLFKNVTENMLTNFLRIENNPHVKLHIRDNMLLDQQRDVVGVV
jgi:hypothetical protein